MGSSFWDKANRIYSAVESFAEKRVSDMQTDYERKQLEYERKIKMKSNDELNYMLKNAESPALKSMIYEEMKRRGM